MRRVRVLDASALVAFCGGYQPLVRLFSAANLGQEQLTIPVGAVLDANHTLNFSQNEWSGVGLLGGITFLALAEHIAIEIGPWPGDVGTRHALYEARIMSGMLVTRRPDHYVGADVEVYVI